MDVPYVGVVNSCDPREGAGVAIGEGGGRIASCQPRPSSTSLPLHVHTPPRTHLPSSSSPETTCAPVPAGLYVKFDSSPEEMLITNEDDWRWGSHSRKPPETAAGRGGR